MKIIGFEEHYGLPAIYDAAIKAGDPYGLILETLKKAGHFPLPADPQAGFPAGIYDLGEGRIAAMDDAGIDVQILSYATPSAERLEPSLAKELTRQANDTLAAAISTHPERFLGFATLPMLEPPAAAGELERTVRDLGFVGAMINGNVNGRYLDEKFFWPVFECAEALGVPIYLHVQYSAQTGSRRLLQRFRSRGICVSVDCGSRLAHRQWDTLPALNPGRSVRPVPCAANHSGPQPGNIELDGVAGRLRISVKKEWWAETDHQGISSGKLLRWNPRW